MEAADCLGRPIARLKSFHPERRCETASRSEDDDQTKLETSHEKLCTDFSCEVVGSVR